MRFIALALMSLFTLGAHAAEPTSGALGLQPAATPVMEQAVFFHNIILLPIITVIVIFVMALLGYVMFRYNRKANPVPSKFSHNTTIEIVWTLVPVLILLFIAFFSFRLLYMEDVLPEAEESEWVTVKATASQWKWNYTYDDFAEVDGDDVYPLDITSLGLHAGLTTDQPGTAAAPRNLATTMPMVVPADTFVRVNVTANLVIHSFAVPSFGVKIDAVPGKLNQTWFKVKEPGVYYGQCSELCGKDHAFMPIEIRVVSKEQYQEWGELALTDQDAAKAYVDDIFGFSGSAPTEVASIR